MEKEFYLCTPLGKQQVLKRNNDKVKGLERSSNLLHQHSKNRSLKGLEKPSLKYGKTAVMLDAISKHEGKQA